MSKIIYTSEEDFIKQEIAEHGYDYVDAQFAMGYEPGLINMPSGKSFYAWIEADHVLRFLAHDNGSSDTSCHGVYSNSSNLSNCETVLVN